ncbi:trypco2 family protein [Streptomyces sp. B1I3]|uniref:trypco2 family protein n=1 Tax=Streptomyces sp. B1I3 TaxID=3042264 RepID=UPI00278825E4|nr:hypothetical protein [Streptomyces sp. B1I3]
MADHTGDTPRPRRHRARRRLEPRREHKAGAKVKAWVAEGGADTSRTTGRTHKAAFTLAPRTP